MARGWIIGIAAVVIVGAAATGFALFPTTPAASSPAGVPQAAPATGNGTAVTVLIDFSRSFIPIGPGNVSKGLLEVDRTALRGVARALERLAWGTWRPPVKIVWNPITAGDLVTPLCDAMLVDSTKLVSTPGVLINQAAIKAALEACLATIVNAAKDVRRLADHTDISAAVAAAQTEVAQYDQRILIVLSDFKEDLAPGNTVARFRLTGDSVLLLHRAGTDGENVEGYLARIEAWKANLGRLGAGQTAAIPLLAVSPHRLRLALNPAEKRGTSLTVLIDPKPNVLSSAGGVQGATERLARLAQDLAKVSETHRWPPPVTAQWVRMAPNSFQMRAWAPLDFDPTNLIAREGEINRASDFGEMMGELARSLSAGGTPSAGDLTGSMALLASAAPAPASHVVVILSDFADGPMPGPAFRFTGDTRVVFLHTPSTATSDVNVEAGRRGVWSKYFEDHGASRVCQIRLATWTSAELARCLDATASAAN